VINRLNKTSNLVITDQLMSAKSLCRAPQRVAPRASVVEPKAVAPRARAPDATTHVRAHVHANPSPRVQASTSSSNVDTFLAASRQSTRPKKPTERYVPVETKMVDDDDSDADIDLGETSSEDSSDDSSDEEMTAEDKAFIVEDDEEVSEDSDDDDFEPEAESTESSGSETSDTDMDVK